MSGGTVLLIGFPIGCIIFFLLPWFIGTQLGEENKNQKGSGESKVYREELWELYKTAGMQRHMSCTTMRNMDLNYSSLSQLVGELEEVGITTYQDLDKLKALKAESTEGCLNNDN